MRNYIELDAIHAHTTFNTNYLAIGRSKEEARTRLDTALTGYGGTIITAEELKIYFELSKDNFYSLLWFGAESARKITGNAPSQRVWNDGAPTTGGYVVDLSDFIEFESPRGKERRKFRLVPIKKS